MYFHVQGQNYTEKMAPRKAVFAHMFYTVLQFYFFSNISSNAWPIFMDIYGFS